jgi:hypothetical protein
VKELKDWLGRLYAEGDESIRTCIITATLEHLFEQKDIRESFPDWKKDPVLAITHREACVVLGWREDPAWQASIRASQAFSQIVVALSRLHSVASSINSR